MLLIFIFEMCGTLLSLLLDSECTLIGDPSGLDVTEQRHVADCWVSGMSGHGKKKKKIVEEYLKWYIIER